MHGIIVAENNFEDIELVATRDILLRAGIKVSVSSLLDTLLLRSKCGLRIKADILFSETNFENYDFLIIPGGNWAVLYNEKTPYFNNLNSIIKDFYNNKKLVAAICAGPRILSYAGILKEKEYVAFPGISENIKLKAKNKKAYTYKNVITASGPASAYLFAFEIVKYLKGNEALKKVKNDLNY